MKKLFILTALVLSGYFAEAQTNPMPTTDSLIKFINKYIRNDATTAFTNNRLNTALVSAVRFIEAFSGGGGVVNLDTARGPSTATIQPSGGGTVAIIKSVDVGSNKAGLMTPSMKLSLDSAITKRVVLNDSTTVYYNSQGLEVYRVVDSAFTFVPPLYPISSRAAGVKNDSAAWNAKSLQGRAIAATAPTDGQAIVWDNAGSTWKPGTVSGGGGTPGGSNTQIQFNNSSSFGGDAGLTYNSTTNELTTDSVKSKTVYGDSGVFVSQGRYDYDNSFWRPGIRFIGENKTGIARLSGITTFIDNGAKNVGIWREGADTDVIFGYGANRLTVEATGSMNHVSLVGRMEFEGLGNGGYIDWVGYQAGSSLGRTIRITTDATSYGNSVVPIHFVPRNGFHAFRITDSVNAVKMHFSSQGWLGIGNDTAQRAIHVRNNGDVYERLESLSLTGIIGHEYYVQGNEKWSNKIDVNSGQITENIGTGGYFKRWQINGTNAIGLDADRTVFVNNRLFVGTTSSLGIGEKLAVNGTIAIADGNQVVEPSGISGFRISTSAGTDIFYGSGATQGKVQLNPHLSYIYNSVEKFRVTSGGQVWINPAGVSSAGSFTLQNTGDLYQQGSFRLGGTNAAIASDAKVLVLGTDSVVRQKNISEITSIYPWDMAGVDSANTSNATNTTVKTLTIPDASRGIIEVRMACIGTDDGTKGLTGIKRVRYKKTGGTLTLGTVEDEMAIERDGGLTTATFTITTSSNNIIIQVTGEAATNLKWKPTYLMTNNAIAL